MLTAILTVLTASLVGSLHCAGMCGPFVAFAVGPHARGGDRVRLQVAYHLGRLCTYTLLGAIAGTVGAALDLSAGVLGLSKVASVLAGGIMVVFGAAVLLQTAGVRVPAAPLPTPVRNLVMRGQRWALQRAPLHRAGLIGLLTTFLPCGWLYAFAFTAAGTGHPLWGALTMAVFWLGTVPALAAVGVSVQALAGALAPRLPVITAIALVGVGLFTLSGRARIDTVALAAAAHASVPGGGATADGGPAVCVPDADETPACCREKRDKGGPK